MYSQVLVPLDGSKAAERALPHAEGICKSHGAAMHLLMVFTRHPRAGNTSGAGLEADRSVEAAAEIGRQVEQAQIDSAQEYLEDIAERLKQQGVSVQTEIGEGSAHEHIIDYAKKHSADLIVMSTHGHGGLKRMLIGSVTDRVIRMGEVPVLVIP
jgi:nucleotide-binding universal stress UspA family protein